MIWAQCSTILSPVFKPILLNKWICNYSIYLWAACTERVLVNIWSSSTFLHKEFLSPSNFPEASSLLIQRSYPLKTGYTLKIYLYTELFSEHERPWLEMIRMNRVSKFFLSSCSSLCICETDSLKSLSTTRSCSSESPFQWKYSKFLLTALVSMELVLKI